MNKNYISFAVNNLNREISYLEKEINAKKEIRDKIIKLGKEVKVKRYEVVEEAKESLRNLTRLLGLPHNWFDNILNPKVRKNIDFICDWTGLPILKLTIDVDHMMLDIEIIEYNKHHYIPIKEVEIVL